jgi:hypothetical protein
MAVIFDAVLPAKERGAANAAALEQAQDEHWHAPPDIPAELGTPEEFRRRWQGGELDIFAKTDGTRRNQIIRVKSTGLREHLEAQPDEEERLGPADEPPGRWEGLRRVPEQPGS